MSVVCGRPCPFGNGIYCTKGIIILNALGQCEEHWGKQGQPILMRDPYVENMDSYLKKVAEKVEENCEKCEDKGNNNDTNAESIGENLTANTEKGAETQDET